MTPTICKKCKFFLIGKEHRKTPRELVWYNLYCKASPLAPAVDPVLGGTVYDNDLPYEHCRDVNTAGHCPKFEQEW